MTLERRAYTLRPGGPIAGSRGEDSLLPYGRRCDGWVAGGTPDAGVCRASRSAGRTLPESLLGSPALNYIGLWLTAAARLECHAGRVRRSPAMPSVVGRTRRIRASPSACGRVAAETTSGAD